MTTTMYPPGRIGSAAWRLDSGLARLAFGSRSPRGGAAADSPTLHLAFLPSEALELDLSDPAQREFGDYELQEQIGQGGMGVVYRARQKHLERDVALKLLSAGPWASEEFVAAFQREARNAASLQHPNVVAVYEMGEHDGLIFYAMQLIRGESLAQRLDRQRRLPVREAAVLVRTVAEAVDYAHRLGVLHLDLKPGNILLDEAGVAQVTDFGLARRLGQAASLENEQVSGTPSYMAPEQAQVRSARLSAATDIWGLGAVLYELCTGRPPFTGDSPRQVLDQVLTAPVRAPSRYACVPRDLEAICLKCLARPAAERYGSARELADDLGRWLENRSVRARPLNAAQRINRWARREPKLALAIGSAMLALVVGLAAATWQWQRADAAAASAREQTWRTRGDASWRLVEEGRSVDALPLLVANLRERESHGDTDGAALERLRLGTLRRSGAQLIDAIATGARVGRAVDVDRDGRYVAVADMDEDVRLFSVADGQLLWHAATRQGGNLRAAGLPLTRVEFSPDGRYLVSATMEPGPFVRPHGRNNVLIDSVDGRVIEPPPGVFAEFLDATFSADGSHAVLRARNGDAQLFSVADWRPRTPMRRFPSLGGSWRVADGGRFVVRAALDGVAIELIDVTDLSARRTFAFDHAHGVVVWAAQTGGSLLALGHRDGRVQLLDPMHASLRELQPAASEDIRVLNFSHDGRWLLAASGPRILIWEVESGIGGALPIPRSVEAWRIEGDAASGTVFVAGANTNDSQLWQLPDAKDGADLAGRLAAARPLVTQFGFGPSSPRNAAAYAPAANLVVNIERDGELRLWRWHEGRVLSARASPPDAAELTFDGRHVAVVDGSVVRVIEVDDERSASPPLAHPQAVTFAALTPNGDSLVTVSGRALHVFDWRSGEPRWPPTTLKNSPLRVVVSPDSTHLLVTSGSYLEGHFHELASSFDLGTGHVLADAVPLPGPVDGLRHDREGRRLVHWRGEQAQVRDGKTLRPIGAPVRFGSDITAFWREAGGRALHAAELGELSPIVDAGFDGSRDRLTLIVSGSEPQKPRLIKVDIGSGASVRTHSLPPGMMPRLWPRGDGHDFVISENLSKRAHLLDDEGRIRPLQLPRGSPGPTQAISQNGRWLAQTSSEGVLLIDRDSGEWASALLPAPRAQDGETVQLAFSADGSRLLARARSGQWQWWPLAPEREAIAQIERRVRHLRPEFVVEDEKGALAPSAEERDVLRQDDPGLPNGFQDDFRTAEQSPIRIATESSISNRLLFVNLEPASNRSFVASQDLAVWRLLHDPAIPHGHQRFLDIDFDIRAPVLLAMPETPRYAQGLRVESEPVSPSAPNFVAVHLLMSGCCMLPSNAGGAYAYLRLHYSDGSQTRIPILHGRDMLPAELNAGDSETPRIAWVDTRSRVQGGGLRLYAPRLSNPHPDRAVDALVFEASEHFASGPVIYAATLETIPVPGDDGS